MKSPFLPNNDELKELDKKDNFDRTPLPNSNEEADNLNDLNDLKDNSNEEADNSNEEEDKQ